MGIYSEEEDDGDRVFELKGASTTFGEVQTPAAPANADESSHNKLLNLPSPKVDLERTGVK